MLFVDLRTYITHTTPYLIVYRHDGNRGHRGSLLRTTVL